MEFSIVTFSEIVVKCQNRFFEWHREIYDNLIIYIFIQQKNPTTSWLLDS